MFVRCPTLRDFSQLSEEHKTDDSSKEGEALPDVPPAPELPDVPKLTPSLPSRPEPSAGEEPGQYQRMGLAYMLPIALAAPVIVLTLAGYWLDGHFHTPSYFTMGGALLGFISGLVNMLRIASKLNR
jgi:hypothetical protein